MKIKLIAFVIAMSFSWCFSASIQAAAAKQFSANSSSRLSAPVRAVANSRGGLQAATATRNATKPMRGAPVFEREKNLEGVHSYIVQLNDPPLAMYRGGVGDFAATSPEYLARHSTSRQKLNTRSAASRAYADHLRKRQADFKGAAKKDLGITLQANHEYVFAFNGFSAQMSQDQAASIAALPGVRRITRDLQHPLLTDAGPTFIGAPAIWDGSAYGGVGTKGEGVIVGIMDTGINGDHPSFAATGGDGYTHTNPFGDGTYVGECATNPSACNSKLIGRWDPSGSASGSEDTEGHGSHVAGTAAGNVLDGVPLNDAEGNPMNYSLGEFSGVAPHANIIAYKVCATDTCATSAVIAGTEQGIIDGVDVLNHSIGSAFGSPWGDPKSEAFKAARAAGISLANSAGNSGTDAAGNYVPGSVNGTGSAPWTASVAASSHDRAFPTKQIHFGGAAGAPASVTGRSITEGLNADIVYAGDYTNANDPGGDPAQCLQPFPAGTFNGEIVLCDRGAIARVDKAIHVRDGGAGGFVLCNIDGGAAFLADDTHVIPGIQIIAEDCNPVRDWLATGSGHTAEIEATAAPIRDPDAGDIMATFSSRGPYPDMEYLAPHITAPGLSIFAAYADPIDYAFLQGTSMSSPHIAGSFALMTAAQPDWTDAELFSAMMMTAKDTVMEDIDPAVFLGPLRAGDAFDFGAGRVQLQFAAAAGMVLDETDGDYTAADPALGGDPRQLNLASLYNTQCLGSCSWTRTFRATKAGSWSLESDNVAGVGINIQPQNFTLAVGEEQEVIFAADVNTLDANQWIFSKATLTDSTGASPDLSLPLVVQTAAAIFPEKLAVGAERDAGSMALNGFRTAQQDSLSATAFGLATPEGRLVQISGSVDDFTPYTGNATQIEFYNVPSGSVQFIAETVASTAPDVDLFVGIDANQDRAISPDEELCQSGNADSFELCELSKDQLNGGGIFWVAVINYAGSGDDIVDDTNLDVTVVSPSIDNSVWAETPAAVAGGAPFDVRVFWNKDMEYGVTYRGAVELSGPDGSLGVIPLEVTRNADDVKLHADASGAVVGDVLTMAAEVRPNESPEDRNYIVSSPIPEGVDLVPGSVTGGTHSFVINEQIIWMTDQLSLTAIGRSYQPSINGPNVDPNHPLYDANCDTGFGGYVDLDAFGFDLNTDLAGNQVSFTGFEDQNVYFYGEDIFNGIRFTDDGFLYFGGAVGVNPGSNSPIPNLALPNSMAAILWNDMEIVADATTGSGVTMATGGVNLSVIEFDNMQPAPAGSTANRVDFVALVSGRYNDDPGEYELIYAYDNVVGDWSDATIGVENADGSYGTSYDGPLSDGLIICWDYQEQPRNSDMLSYQVVIGPSASDSAIDTTVFNRVDTPGTVEVIESMSVSVAASDTDDDGIADHNDNCALVSNPDQIDADNDGYGNLCDADLNQDLVVNFPDVLLIMDSFDTADPVADLDSDGVVDWEDVEIFKTMWMSVPGPSGLR